MEKERAFCQSCAMPLEKPEDFGTEKDGGKSQDYCQYCFQHGVFTSDMTMEEMIAFCAPMTVEGGMAKTEDEAKDQMRQFFPKLKRWAQ